MSGGQLARTARFDPNIAPVSLLAFHPFCSLCVCRSTIAEQKKFHDDMLEKVRGEFAQEIDSLKAALELARGEGRDNVRLARSEAEGRSQRETMDAVRALTTAHEAEMRRAGKEVVRLQVREAYTCVPHTCANKEGRSLFASRSCVANTLFARAEAFEEEGGRRRRRWGAERGVCS